MPDTETSFAELQARCDKTIAFIEERRRAAFAGAEDRAIEMKFPNGMGYRWNGADYLRDFALPNFYFHATTAYAIMRAGRAFARQAGFPPASGACPSNSSRMNIRAPAILCAARPHGETAVIARLLTARARAGRGLCRRGAGAATAAGGDPRQPRRGRTRVRKSDSQLPFARLELVESRGPWLGEPLPAAAIAWVTALTATALPERHAYPALYEALAALLDAICHCALGARLGAGAGGYEVLLLRELGYGGGSRRSRGRSAGDCSPRWTNWPGRSTATCLPTGAAMLWPRAHCLRDAAWDE